MWGRATLAMEVSRTSMKAASATVPAINHGLAFGFHCPLVLTFTSIPLPSGGNPIYRYRMTSKTIRIHYIYNMYLKAYCMLVELLRRRCHDDSFRRRPNIAG